MAFASLCFWHGTAGREGADARLLVLAGLRGSIVAFLVAGLFSTTMEEPKLWIIPAICLLALAALAISGRKAIRLGGAMAWAGATALLVCAGLWLGGSMLARKDALKITRQGERITILPANTARLHRLQVAVDKSVLGNDYGKLLRRLAQTEGLAITVTDDDSPMMPCDLLILTGDTIPTASLPAAGLLVLIAPAKSDFESASRLLNGSRRVTVLLPAFDEDGRVRFWDDLLRDKKPATTMPSAVLDGVGTQVEWAWEQVIACIHSLLRAQSLASRGPK